MGLFVVRWKERCKVACIGRERMNHYWVERKIALG